jgi:hypothetical protein
MPDGSGRLEVFDGEDLAGARARWAELRAEIDAGVRGRPVR